MICPLCHLEDLGDDAIEEVAIVADDQHGLGLLDEIIFEPARGVDVEMVARLVEQHHVGRGQEQLGQHQPALLAATECVEWPFVLLRRKPRPSRICSMR